MKEGLIGLHYVQVNMDREVEEVEDLVQHFAVLGGDADDGLPSWVLLECFKEGCEFNGFGTCSEDKECAPRFVHTWGCSSWVGAGGADGIRTRALRGANAALLPLSYGPASGGW